MGLLQRHAAALRELKRRGIVRSANNPVGDYAEYLFCLAFGWRMAAKSEPDADAVGPDGTRYQIKGRRLHGHRPSRQLGALRKLPEGRFDFLAAVLFGEDFEILRAALVPHPLVLERSTFTAHTNSWLFMMRDDVWQWPSVRDVTEDLRRAQV